VAIKSAYIQEGGNGKLQHEEAMVLSQLKTQELPYTLFTLKKMHRRTLKLTQQDLIVGSITVIKAAMKQLGIVPPIEDSYPVPLKRYLHRSISSITLGTLRSLARDGLDAPLFIKPKSKTKLFAGKVIYTESDLYSLSHLSAKTNLYCSNVVSWLSEFRVYVVHGQIRNISFYEGDARFELESDIVEQAVSELYDSKFGPAGYALDFGVLADGRTALIEMNDGFALGAYGVSAKDYTDLIMARWQELLATITAKEMG